MDYFPEPYKDLEMAWHFLNNGKKVYDDNSLVRTVCLEPVFSFRFSLDLAEIHKNEK